MKIIRRGLLTINLRASQKLWRSTNTFSSNFGSFTTAWKENRVERERERLN